jgi:hypothetical protein
MTFPAFTAGEVLRAQDMNAVGLWKISSGLLTASGVTLDSIFTADYDQYLIRVVALDGGTAGADSSWDILFRTSGTDNTSSSYRYQFSQFATSGTFGRQTAALAKAQLLPATGATLYQYDLQVFNPFSNTKNTFYTAEGSADGTIGILATGQFNANTRFDGIKVRFNGTSVGGQYYVYGYRN